MNEKNLYVYIYMYKKKKHYMYTPIKKQKRVKIITNIFIKLIEEKSLKKTRLKF